MARGKDNALDAADDIVAVTKHDSTDDPNGPFRGFYILGATGILRIETENGSDRTIPSGLAVGVLHPIRVRRVYNSTTTATDVWGVR